eukprot:1469698-Rhodomonas_salina.1
MKKAHFPTDGTPAKPLLPVPDGCELVALDVCQVSIKMLGGKRLTEALQHRDTVFYYPIAH